MSHTMMAVREGSHCSFTRDVLPDGERVWRAKLKGVSAAGAAMAAETKRRRANRNMLPVRAKLPGSLIGVGADRNTSRPFPTRPIGEICRLVTLKSASHAPENRDRTALYRRLRKIVFTFAKLSCD